jgi:hypothetical protein
MRRRSWVDAISDAVGRLPFPGWMLFVVIAAVSGGVSLLLRLWDGTPVSPITIAFAAATPLPLTAVVYIRGAARRALADFRPAMGELESRYPEYERRLTSTGTVTSIIALVLGGGVVIAGQLLAAGGWGITGQTSVATNVWTSACQTVLNVGFVLFVVRAVSQTRTIAELHRDATAVNLWETGPQVAFARLTLAMAVIIAVPYAVIEAFAMAFDESSVLEIAIFVLALGVAIVIFVVPLLGMRRRLVIAKAGVLAESDGAFDRVTTRLHASVQAGELGGAGELNDALSALVVSHERLRKISTWPWSPDTLRGFLSSVGLPILLWVVTALLDRFVDF